MMAPKALRRKILKLEVKVPITEKLEDEFAARKSRKRHPWYSSQKEHWLGWLKEYDGPGYYGRENWDVEAKTVYNRVVIEDALKHKRLRFRAAEMRPSD